MMRFGYFLFLTLSLIIPGYANGSTTINTVSQTIGMNFGKISPQGGGTITSAGVVSGPKSLGGWANASFTVTGTSNNTGAGRKFQVFITNLPTNLSNGSSTAPITYTLTSGSNVTSKTISVTGNNFSTTVPVYGTLTVSSFQSSGNYSGSYSFIACPCTTTCPSTPC